MTPVAQKIITKSGQWDQKKLKGFTTTKETLLVDCKGRLKTEKTLSPVFLSSAGIKQQK